MKWDIYGDFFYEVSVCVVFVVYMLDMFWDRNWSFGRGFFKMGVRRYKESGKCFRIRGTREKCCCLLVVFRF